MRERSWPVVKRLPRGLARLLLSRPMSRFESVRCYRLIFEVARGLLAGLLCGGRSAVVRAQDSMPGMSMPVPQTVEKNSAGMFPTNLLPERQRRGGVTVFAVPNRMSFVGAAQFLVWHLAQPEGLKAGCRTRTRASVEYSKPLTGKSWSSSIIWGRNQSTYTKRNLNSYTVESVFANPSKQLHYWAHGARR